MLQNWNCWKHVFASLEPGLVLPGLTWAAVLNGNPMVLARFFIKHKELKKLCTTIPA